MNENQELGTVSVQDPAPSNADIMADLMENYQPEAEVETETTEDLPEVTEETVNEVVEVKPEAKPTTADTNTNSKTNQAFKNMREELNRYKQSAQTNESYANVIKEIAEANGVTPDELIKNYNDRKIKDEAEKAGVSVDVYNKLNSLEKEVSVLRNKPIEDRFNSQIEKLIETYKLSEDDLGTFYSSAIANGFDLTKVKDVQKVYEFLNVDQIISKREQERLEQKEKVKKQTTLPPDVSTTVEVDEDQEIEKMLKLRGAWNG